MFITIKEIEELAKSKTVQEVPQESKIKNIGKEVYGLFTDFWFSAIVGAIILTIISVVR